jgi:hypothetical protein
MDTRLQLLAVAASGALLLVLLELVRRRRLLERYAILWLFSASVLLLLSLWTGALKGLANLVHVDYAPNALFAVAFGFVLVLLLHFSLAVSRLTDQSKVLAQRLALLEERLHRQEAATAEQAAERDPDEVEHLPSASRR